jgi:tol-pal system protein YbgF
MEREMATLARSVYKGDVPPPNLSGGMDSSQLASFELRMNQMDDQLRRLTGMIEENSFRIRQLQNTIDGLSSTSANGVPTPSDRNDMIGTGINTMDNTGNSNIPTSVDDTPYRLGTITNNNQTNTPAGLYDQAFSFMQNDNYAAAQNAFEEFVNRYPDHSLAANSKYWLGETYYEQGDYQQASRAFARAFKDHPDGQKAPDTLLRLAMSLEGQGMNEEACLTLAELENRFPNAPSQVSTQAGEVKSEYGCN